MTKKSFHLRWNNHLQNLQSLFENLYNEQSLVDVTLSCTDGLLYAHKLVLSACSPYFEQIFKDNRCKHPIMILKGIKCQDMQALLQYMYIGSVDVGEEDLEMLLDTASDLHIKGLVQTNEKTPHYPYKNTKKLDKEPQTTIMPAPTFTQPKEDLRWQAELVAKPSASAYSESVHNPLNIIRNNMTEENCSSTSNKPMQDEDVIEFDPLYPNTYETSVNVDDYQETSEEESKLPVESIEECSENIQTSYQSSDTKTLDADEAVTYLCHMCSRSFLNKGSYHRHMLTHAGVKPHHCTFCEQSFLRLSHLQRHIRVHTGERPYSCGQCPKQFARSDKLRQHYIIQHNGKAGNKPRGRPRKNTPLYPPTTSSANVSPINSMYPVSINPISMNAV